MECAYCHATLDPDAVPHSHDAKFARTHGADVRDMGSVRVMDTNCSKCHKDAFCMDCHRRTPPRDHNLFWKRAGHGLGSDIDRERCGACHGQDECIACHEWEYDAQHGDSGYPTTCLSCHDRDAWAGAVFDHDADYFPITSGRHQGGWTGCPICHVNSTDFTEFSCFGCHAHDQSRMDPRHAEVPGYAYDSALCYACHPRGEAD